MMTRQEMIDEAVRSTVCNPGPWCYQLWRDFPESLALHILPTVRDRFRRIRERELHAYYENMASRA